MKRFSPVTAFTFKGKATVSLVKFLLFFVRIILGHRWHNPVKNFEENPRYFKRKDIAYLSYKYYYHQLILPDKGSGIREHFADQRFSKSDLQGDVTISLGGDLMPYKCVNTQTCKYLWDEVGEFFFSSDIVFANLETPIDLTKKPGLCPEVMLGDMLFNGSEECFRIFNPTDKFKGFSVMSVANNHAMDQDKEGYVRTLQFLSEKNVPFCGGALTKKTRNDFPIFVHQGISVAFIAYTFSLNQFDLPDEDDWMCNHIRLNKEDVDISIIIEQAAAARARGADIVVASLHMGNAYQAYTSGHIIRIVQRICREAGIDIIAGSHPHNPQPVEWFSYEWKSVAKRALIFYSLGDFVAYDIFSWTHLSLMVKIHLSKINERIEITGFDILPAYMLAEIKSGKIESLKFRHLKDVVDEMDMFDAFTRRDAQNVERLYKELLFTDEQRSAVELM